MQFHLNGFRPGDPHVMPCDARGRSRDSSPEAEVDVLIVGCGPAGLTLAAQLAASADIHTRIVDQKDGPLQLGQADGVACRTMEMFQAFGFVERVLKESYWVNETVFWKPDPARPGHIARSGRIQDTEDGLSEFPHVILNQARVHDFYLETMRHGPAGLEPHYRRRLVSVTPGDPAIATLVRPGPTGEDQIETVRARFVVGCDGARSQVRNALGLPLRGDSANQAWGVMDVLAVTDFPDIRLKSVVQSSNEGAVLIIPREGGYLVRLYIELEKLAPDERVASRGITPDHLIAAARRILHPYSLEVKEVAWWSVYEIGQRLCDRFDDRPEGAPQDHVPSVYIAGDACHTHSPKAGQGMNVSMQDGFNLGWKLAAVVRGRASPAILQTYSDERQAVAKALIDFDREFARMFSTPPRNPDDPDSVGADPAELQDYFVRQGRFTAGTAVVYPPSIITAAPTWQHLARGLPIGMRLHSAPVIRLADAKPVHLGHVVEADGRWRLFAFADAGDPLAPASRLNRLCEFLSASPRSPLVRYRRPGEDIDALIDVRAVLQQRHRDVAFQALPSLLRPAKGRYGLCDFEKVFCPDLRAGQDIFDLRGVDRAAGCLIVVRPDQFVAHIAPLDDHAALSTFFDRFMVA
jgi:phenol 2-monooxygenase